MNLWLRLLVILARALRAPRRHPLEPFTLQLRVYPNDLDLNLHMNNGRFLTIMDLGRLDLVTRTGLAQTFWKHRWRPVVAALSMRFRRPLAPWQAYELETRLVAWDDNWFYFEQTFRSRGEVAAVGQLKTTLLGPRGKVPSPEVAQASGLGVHSPPLPEWAERM